MVDCHGFQEITVTGCKLCKSQLHHPSSSWYGLAFYYEIFQHLGRDSSCATDIIKAKYWKKKYMGVWGWHLSWWAGLFQYLPRWMSCRSWEMMTRKVWNSSCWALNPRRYNSITSVPCLYVTAAKNSREDQEKKKERREIFVTFCSEWFSHFLSLWLGLFWQMLTREFTTFQIILSIFFT